MSTTREQFITTAVQFEQAGYDFYTQAAGQASSDLARGVFESLAQDELRHIGWIKTLSTGGATAQGEIDSLAQRLRPIFRDADGAQASAGAAPADIAALNVGIEREDASVKAYEDCVAAETGELCDLCTVLVGVERTHRRLLENVVQYLEHPEEFFLREERWIVEG